jgi:hypothetical protein
MQNDDTQVDDLENTSDDSQDTTSDDHSDDESQGDGDEQVTDWEKEAKKWEAIAKRNAKKAEKAKETPATDTPDVPLDKELVMLTYRNFLTGLGITSPSVQDEAMATAKKLGMSISQLQSDPVVMEIFMKKQEKATTNASLAKGSSGASKRSKGVDFHASQIASGRPITDISGDDAVKLLERMAGRS